MAEDDSEYIQEERRWGFEAIIINIINSKLKPYET